MTHEGDAPHELPAGAFSTWLADLQVAQRGEGSSDVPCGTCTACCTSSQFVHIGPDETDALDHIPVALLFPAPGRPKGHVLMGYDENGHCPMLTDNACSIYAHRPRTCRTYDCRVFPAAGVGLEHDDKPLIADRAAQWRFSFPTEADRARHAATQAAARSLEEHRARLDDLVPSNPTQLAVLAVEIHEVFLLVDGATGRADVVSPSVAELEAEIRRRHGSFT